MAGSREKPKEVVFSQYLLPTPLHHRSTPSFSSVQVAAPLDDIFSSSASLLSPSAVYSVSSSPSPGKSKAAAP
ncbi:hypothetical protein ACFX2A_047869 [Malus domestica]